MRGGAFGVGGLRKKLAQVFVLCLTGVCLAADGVGRALRFLQINPGQRGACGVRRRTVYSSGRMRSSRTVRQNTVSMDGYAISVPF